MLTWLLMMRPFFLSGSQKVYKSLDIDLSANISVIGFQIKIIIGYPPKCSYLCIPKNNK